MLTNIFVVKIPLIAHSYRAHSCQYKLQSICISCAFKRTGFYGHPA